MSLQWDFAACFARYVMSGIPTRFHGVKGHASLSEARAFLRSYGLALRRNAKAGLWDVVPCVRP